MSKVHDICEAKQRCERALNKLVDLHHGDANHVADLLWTIIEQIKVVRANQETVMLNG